MTTVSRVYHLPVKMLSEEILQSLYTATDNLTLSCIAHLSNVSQLKEKRERTKKKNQIRNLTQMFYSPATMHQNIRKHQIKATEAHDCRVFITRATPALISNPYRDRSHPARLECLACLAIHQGWPVGHIGGDRGRGRAGESTALCRCFSTRHTASACMAEVTVWKPNVGM